MIVKPIATAASPADQAGSNPTTASQPVTEPTTLSFEGFPEDQLHVWLFVAKPVPQSLAPLADTGFKAGGVRCSADRRLVTVTATAAAANGTVQATKVSMVSLGCPKNTVDGKLLQPLL